MSSLKRRNSNRKTMERVTQTTHNSPKKQSNEVGYSFQTQQNRPSDQKYFVKYPTALPLAMKIIEDKSTFDNRRS